MPQTIILRPSSEKPSLTDSILNSTNMEYTMETYRVLHLGKTATLETTRPIEAKFYVEPPLDEVMKVNTNGKCHRTKMAAMPIYGKNQNKSSFLEQKGR